MFECLMWFGGVFVTALALMFAVWGPYADRRKT